MNIFIAMTSKIEQVYINCINGKEIMKRENVTIFTLLGALNGYLLLGIISISLVSFCDLHIPGSFSGTRDSGMELTYYTMNTLTTTGNGDITPPVSKAKSLSMLISVAGQFYVAVVVAILVGKYSFGLKK